MCGTSDTFEIRLRSFDQRTSIWDWKALHPSHPTRERPFSRSSVLPHIWLHEHLELVWRQNSPICCKMVTVPSTLEKPFSFAPTTLSFPYISYYASSFPCAASGLQKIAAFWHVHFFIKKWDVALLNSRIVLHAQVFAYLPEERKTHSVLWGGKLPALNVSHWWHDRWNQCQDHEVPSTTVWDSDQIHWSTQGQNPTLQSCVQWIRTRQELYRTSTRFNPPGHGSISGSHKHSILQDLGRHAISLTLLHNGPRPNEGLITGTSRRAAAITEEANDSGDDV